METINDRMEQLVNERFDGNKAAFAKKIGFPPTGLSSYLGKQRRSKPSIDMVCKIITRLDVDPRWLLLGEEPAGPLAASVSATGQGMAAGRDINASPPVAAPSADGVCARLLAEKERVIASQAEIIAEKERVIKLLFQKIENKPHG